VKLCADLLDITVEDLFIWLLIAQSWCSKTGGMGVWMTVHYKGADRRDYDLMCDAQCNPGFTALYNESGRIDYRGAQLDLAHVVDTFNSHNRYRWERM
jgi:hypothetical protein